MRKRDPNHVSLTREDLTIAGCGSLLSLESERMATAAAVGPSEKQPARVVKIVRHLLWNPSDKELHGQAEIRNLLV